MRLFERSSYEILVGLGFTQRAAHTFFTPSEDEFHTGYLESCATARNLVREECWPNPCLFSRYRAATPREVESSMKSKFSSQITTGETSHTEHTSLDLQHANSIRKEEYSLNATYSLLTEQSSSNEEKALRCGSARQRMVVEARRSFNSPHRDAPLPGRRTEFLSSAKYVTDVFVRLGRLSSRNGGYLRPQQINGNALTGGIKKG